VLIGTVYYYTVQVKKGSDVLAEHRADVGLASIPAPLGDAVP
jgi:hypothetical protein